MSSPGDDELFRNAASAIRLLVKEATLRALSRSLEYLSESRLRGYMHEVGGTGIPNPVLPVDYSILSFFRSSPQERSGKRGCRVLVHVAMRRLEDPKDCCQAHSGATFGNLVSRPRRRRESAVNSWESARYSVGGPASG